MHCYNHTVESLTLVSLPINFFDRTFLDWKVTLEPIAARKPPQLNVASVTDAMATPPTIGNSDSTMGMVGVSPRNAAESATLKKGSRAYKRHDMNQSRATWPSPSLWVVSLVSMQCSADEAEQNWHACMHMSMSRCSTNLHWMQSDTHNWTRPILPSTAQYKGTRQVWPQRQLQQEHLSKAAKL